MNNKEFNEFRALSLAKVARFMGDHKTADRFVKGDFSEEELDNWAKKRDDLTNCDSTDSLISLLLGIPTKNLDNGKSSE